MKTFSLFFSEAFTLFSHHNQVRLALFSEIIVAEEEQQDEKKTERFKGTFHLMISK